jgi:hypothetical protein
MRRVFLSYAMQDKAHAKRLLEQLNKVEIAGWMDDADIAGGGALATTIREALRAASAVVVLVSPASRANEWVQFELGAAEALGKLIIPVLVEGSANPLPDAPATLREHQWLDARHRPAEDVAKDIKKALRRHDRD